MMNIKNRLRKSSSLSGRNSSSDDGDDNTESTSRMSYQMRMCKSLLTCWEGATCGWNRQCVLTFLSESNTWMLFKKDPKTYFETQYIVRFVGNGSVGSFTSNGNRVEVHFASNVAATEPTSSPLQHQTSSSWTLKKLIIFHDSIRTKRKDDMDIDDNDMVIHKDVVHVPRDLGDALIAVDDVKMLMPWCCLMDKASLTNVDFAEGKYQPQNHKFSAFRPSSPSSPLASLSISASSTLGRLGFPPLYASPRSPKDQEAVQKIQQLVQNQQFVQHTQDLISKQPPLSSSSCNHPKSTPF
jgi:hypothetical protein